MDGESETGLRKWSVTIVDVRIAGDIMAQTKASSLPQTGSISLAEARRAARTVKIANAAKKKAQGGRRAAIGKSINERYLGHFGVGRSKPIEKKVSDESKSNNVRSPKQDTAG